MYDNITLWSCTINGEPGVATVMIDEAAPRQIADMPLFVVITPTMKIDFADELSGRRRRRSGGDGGGPTDPREAFHEAKQHATYPQPA